MELSHATSDATGCSGKTTSSCNTKTNAANGETIDLPLEQTLLLEAGERKSEEYNLYNLHSVSPEC